MKTLGYHTPIQAGIWGASKTGTCSIVLSEGYEDDIDEIDYIKYTGHGGRDPRSPKQIADAMGHDLETHLKSYSRFNTKDLENAFDPIVDKLNNTDKKLIKN